MAKKNVVSLNVHDFVPVSVLLDIAKMIRKQAALNAKKNKAPLQSNRKTANVYNANLIGITRPESSKDKSSVSLTLSDVAMAFEKGGKPHPIDAKNKPWLIFEGTNGRGNPLVKVKHVDHPGFGARPFLNPAITDTADEKRKKLQEASVKNIRTIISGMKRVVK